MIENQGVALCQRITGACGFPVPGNTKVKLIGWTSASFRTVYSFALGYSQVNRRYTSWEYIFKIAIKLKLRIFFKKAITKQKSVS